MTEKEYLERFKYCAEKAKIFVTVGTNEFEDGAIFFSESRLTFFFENNDFCMTKYKVEDIFEVRYGNDEEDEDDPLAYVITYFKDGSALYFYGFRFEDEYVVWAYRPPRESSCLVASSAIKEYMQK